ncbi:MAG: hypothetical protein KQH59_05195 [Desulfobulbaceae bacterium]|nr:hypothetical protein [Desulfobulbaceae bacterium]
MSANVQQLREEISRLQAELADREAALPAHSVKPHQFMVIESPEDEIDRKQKALNDLQRAGDELSREDGNGKRGAGSRQSHVFWFSDDFE